MSKKARARRKPTTQAPLHVLLECVQVVSDYFGTEPKCHEAAVILQTVGKLLGYDLAPRAVSLVAHDTRTGNVAVFGTIAKDRVPQGRLTVDRSPDPTARTGHIVLTCASPLLLIDATLPQLASSGIDAPSLVTYIDSVDPADGRWLTSTPSGLDLGYMPDPVDTATLLEEWDVPRPMNALFARDIVRLVRGGMTAEDIRTKMVVV